MKNTLLFISIFSLLFSFSFQVSGQSEVDKRFISQVIYGDLNEVKKTVEAGADVHQLDYNNQNALFYALTDYKESDHAMYDYIATLGIDITVIDNNKNTLMHFAANSGADEVIKMLYDKGLDVNAKDDKGNTPLLIAAMGKDYSTVKLLNDLGADIALVDNNGDGILSYLSQEEQWSLVTSLNLSQAQKDELLYLAISDYNNAAFVKENIALGANVDGVNDDDEPLIMEAALWGNLDVVTILVANGVNINGVNEDGENALWYAETKEMWDHLIDNGLDGKHVDNDGKKAPKL